MANGTGQSSEDSLQEAEIEELIPEQPPTADWMLVSLVDLCNRLDMGVSISLQTRGGFVTGKLIGVRKFYREYAKLWRGTLPPDPATGMNVFEQEWTQMANQADQDWKEYREKEERGEEVGPWPLPLYVHLKDAQFVYGSVQVPNPGGLLWRGRLSEVAGYSLGEITVSG